MCKRSGNLHSICSALAGPETIIIIIILLFFVLGLLLLLLMVFGDFFGRLYPYLVGADAVVLFEMLLPILCLPSVAFFWESHLSRRRRQQRLPAGRF